MRLRAFSNVLTIATAGSLVTAQPSGHKHRHEHNRVEKREPDNVTVNAPGPTVVSYELDGQTLDKAKVCQGIADGSLELADATMAAIDCSDQMPNASPSPTDPETPVASSQLSVASPTLVGEAPPSLFASTPAVISSLAVAASSFPLPTPTIDSSIAIATSSSATALSSDPSSPDAGQGLDREFPDNTIDCSTFPSDYGPIAVDWAGLGGWSGIQYVKVEGDSITHIDTANPGGQCSPGAMCSYACPAGYQKSQWPSTQGSSGQSVGGLQCNANGKLALTNPGLSKNLCVQGTGATVVQNKLSENAAICRTDYPGTEAELVPLNTQPDSTNPLTCPDAGSYYQHQGAATSAQYYINHQGVGVKSACAWGTDGKSMGNWAPSFLGVGQDMNGKTWLSISTTAENNPTNYEPLNYTVEITGDISGKCKLSGGKYCSGDGYTECNDQGCTVELMSGKATYVLS